MQWKNALTDLLQIEYPIVQAPMLGVSTPEMVAAISNVGGLGSLPVGGLAPSEVAELIQRTKSLTDKPFAVNLFAHDIPVIDESAFDAMQDFLQDFAVKYHLPFTKQRSGDLQFVSWKDQIDILIEEHIPIVSFTFGTLDPDAIQKLKSNGATLIGTATCLKEAQILANMGIDVITAQGIEAGGHRGSFLTGDLPMIGSMALIPAIVDAIRKPVLAAGSIADGRGIKAALILGAQGVQVGSAFIACKESAMSAAQKEKLRSAIDADMVLTKAITGRYARGINNEIITKIDNSALAVPSYPFQIPLTAFARTAGQKQNNKDLMVIWAGQYAFKAQADTAAEIFASFILQVENI